MFYKYLPSEKHYESLKDIKILSFGYTEYNDEPSILHSHSNCEILIPLNSSGYLKFLNKKVPLQVGQYIIINNNVMHTEISKRKTDQEVFKYFTIRLGLEIKRNKEEYYVINDEKTYNEIVRYLSKAYQLLSKDEDDNFGLLNLSCCYYEILKYIEDNNFKITEIKTKMIPEYVINAKNFIITNYGNNISLESLAEDLNISINLLELRFKQHFGMPPKKYLLSIRIKMAKHLLSTTNYNVSQISYLCGFKSPAYFTLIFKKEAGLTPKEFRNKIK